MQLPLFYIAESPNGDGLIRLSEETSRHVVSVLRMQPGDALQLTTGLGKIFKSRIVDAHKKHATVQIEQVTEYAAPSRSLTIAISLLKNTARFEWFLEKATELGITRIIPIISSRTEKQHYREERSKSIIVSAMLQSSQAWLPELLTPQTFINLISMVEGAGYGTAFIAHCVETERKSLAAELLNTGQDRKVIIGPEGDFTEHEIGMAVNAGAIPVALGETRLRTETAGVIAATLIALVNPPDLSR